MEGFRREAVWDPVTRIWHWALAASVITGWLLGEFRTFSLMPWHAWLGYLTGSLLLFRYLWGAIGPRPVRYPTLFATLRDLPSYLRAVGRRRPSGTPGHNPLGVLSIVAIVLALSIQVLSGLFSEEDGLFFSGPLATLLPSRGVQSMTSIHHLFSTVVLVLVGLHVAAVLFYLVWKRENLVTPMLSGWKWVKVDPPPAEVARRERGASGGGGTPVGKRVTSGGRAVSGGRRPENAVTPNGSASGGGAAPGSRRATERRRSS